MFIQTLQVECVDHFLNFAKSNSTIWCRSMLNIITRSAHTKADNRVRLWVSFRSESKDTMEFFNLVLELQLNQEEKAALVAFMHLL
jgi:hypothetical protein